MNTHKRTKWALPLLALLCLPFPTLAEEHTRPRVAVVLSGGGAKGMAHIGALKVIEEAGIPVDIVTGTSMGSIVGGLYSIGYDAHRLDSMVRCQNWPFLLSDKAEVHSELIDKREKEYTYALGKEFVFEGWKLKSSTGGLVEGRNLKILFDRLTEGYRDSLSFDSLPIRFACVSTNIVDNSEYVFHSGRIAEAMRASMSIPAVFTPIRKDSMLLVDGGLRNNYPADIARQMGADIIIGVTVQAPPKKADDIKNSAAMLGQIIDVNCMNKYAENLSLTDVAIRVNPGSYSAASFTPEAVDDLIGMGEKEARKHWAELKQMKERIGEADTTRTQTARHSLTNNESIHWMTDSKKDSEKKTSLLQGHVGFRFDSEELASIQMNAALNPRQSPFTTEATLRLGEHIKGGLDLEYAPKKSGKMRLSYLYQHYSDLDIYSGGERQYNLTYNQHNVTLSLLNLNIRNFKFDAGVEWECFLNKDFLKRDIQEEIPEELGNDKFFSYYTHASYNSENHWYFPSQGTRFEARYAYLTDNLYSFNSHRGIHEIAASWQTAFPLTERFTLQPAAYGRLLNAADNSNDIPYAKMNMVGGDWAGHYVAQQLPLPGIGHMQAAGHCFIACQLCARERIGKKHYVQARITGGQEADYFKDILDKGPLMGYQLGYYYNTLLGPVGATLGYANRTRKVNFYLNIGFEF